MVTETYTYWMNVSAGSSEQKVFITVLHQAPYPNVHATIALSALSIGHDETAGAVGASITEYQQFGPVDVAPGFKHNSIYVEHCASITFGMSARMAWGFAVATLLVHGRMDSP